MKSKTIETLLPEFDQLAASRESTEAMKPRLETEIADMLASGDLDETMATKLQTKRGQLELIPAKLAQLDAKIESVKSEIEADFTQRYVAFDHLCAKITARVRDDIAKAVAPFVVLGNPDAQLAADRAIDQLLSFSLAQLNIVSAKNVVEFPRSQGNVIKAARNLIEPELMLPKLPTRHEAVK